MRQLAREGIALIVVGDTLEETIGLSNTILVMKDGRVQRQFDALPGQKPTPLDIIQYMM
jgi:ribose transport system ATP-binding protein